MALRLPGSIAEVSAQSLGGGGLIQQRVREQASALSSSTPPSSPSSAFCRSPSSSSSSSSSSCSPSSSSSASLFNHASAALHSPHRPRSQLHPSSTKVCDSCTVGPTSSMCEASGKLFGGDGHIHHSSMSTFVLPKRRFLAWPYPPSIYQQEGVVGLLRSPTLRPAGHERVRLIRLSSTPVGVSGLGLAQGGGGCNRQRHVPSFPRSKLPYPCSQGCYGGTGYGGRDGGDPPTPGEVGMKSGSALASAGKRNVLMTPTDNEQEEDNKQEEEEIWSRGPREGDEIGEDTEKLRMLGAQGRGLDVSSAAAEGSRSELWLNDGDGKEEEDDEEGDEEENDVDDEEDVWDDDDIVAEEVVEEGEVPDVQEDEDEEEEIEEDEEGGMADEYVEIGVVMGTHGLKGELKVRSLTDFPKERFERRGRRWLQRPSMSREPPVAVTLVRGRALQGKLPAYLITLKGVGSAKEASRLVGSKVLVRADQRPKLEEEEFYTPDLVGMDIVLQSSREKIGEVVDVFKGPASELLRVRRTATTTAAALSPDGNASKVGTAAEVDAESQREEDQQAEDGRLIWIPFVKEIVPVVDMSNRVMEIDPPEGLLDLNLRPAGSKKERTEKKKREYREKRQSRQKRAALRKVFAAAGQEHVLQGLLEGTEEQRDALVRDLMTVDLRALKKAVAESLATRDALNRPEGGQTPPVENATGGSAVEKLCTHGIEPPTAYVKADWSQVGEWLHKLRHQSDGEELSGEHSKDDNERWWFSGLRLIAEGRAAVMVLAGGQGTRLGPGGPLSKGMLDIGIPNVRSLFELQAQRIRKMQDLAVQLSRKSSDRMDGCADERAEIPWVVMTSSATDECTRTFFEDHSFFGLSPSQVLFMKQGSLSCVEVSADGSHRILMETPWKIARSPDGNGSLFDTLHTEGVLEELDRRGVEYLQVLSVDNALARVADPIFFGFCHEKGAEVGVKVVARASPDEAVGVVCIRHEVPSADNSSSNREQPEPSAQTTRAVRTVALTEDEIEGRNSESRRRNEGEATGPKRVDAKLQQTAAWDGGKEGADLRRSYYGVAEYSELPDGLRRATRSAFWASKRSATGSREEEERVAVDTGGGDSSGELAFQAAHICINVFSMSFLRRVGGKGASLPYHAAFKRIPHVRKLEKGEMPEDGGGEGGRRECEMAAPGWVAISPSIPNGLKMERFIFDAFKFAPLDKVVLLEVDRAEEFAPIKNAAGPNAKDSPETARMLLMSAAARNEGNGWDLFC